MRHFVPEFGFRDMTAVQAAHSLATMSDAELESVFRAYLWALDDDQRCVLENRIARSYLDDSAHERGFGWEDAERTMHYMRTLMPAPARPRPTEVAFRLDTLNRNPPARDETWIDNRAGRAVAIIGLGTMLEVDGGIGETAVVISASKNPFHSDIVKIKDFLSETRYADGIWRPIFQRIGDPQRSA